MQQYLYLVRRSVVATKQSTKQHCAKTRAAPLEIVTLTEMKHNDICISCEGATAERYISSLISVNTKIWNYYILCTSINQLYRFVLHV